MTLASLFAACPLLRIGFVCARLRRRSPFARLFSTWPQRPATLERPPPSSSASSFLPDRFTYVDKTPLLAKIMTGPDQYVFAPAPRRMGKSLTVKMLGAIARGEKDKFAGMAIAEEAGLYDFDKAQYSVVQLSCSGLSSVSDLAHVQAEIDVQTTKIEKLELQIEEEQDPVEKS
jgi:hypothetical protein